MGYEPTPEQIAQAEEKRLKRLEKRLEREKQPKTSLFLSRPWIQLRPPVQLHTQTVKIMTWNVRVHIPVHSSAIHSKHILVVARSVSCSCVRVNVHPYNQVSMNRRIGALPN